MNTNSVIKQCEDRDEVFEVNFAMYSMVINPIIPEVFP